ncbi:MAG: hypothetical protein PWR01_4347 [Clostridiales bacterium]|nr:hypothetical protein [Clostridiales bacterium]MDN5283274.1 hypothetical protein [Candidatus Ozemobacter sp.]
MLFAVRKPFWIVAFLFFTSVCAFAEPQWQFYRINAQYRGAVKKSFTDIGCGVAWFNDTSPGQTQVIAHVCALNPDKKNEIFSFRLNLVLGHNPDSVWVVEKVYTEFKGIRGTRQNEVVQLVCRWDHIRRTGENSRQIKSFINVSGRILNLRPRNLRNSLEINCSTPTRSGFSGKFFLEKASGSAWVIDKFRFRSGKVSVSMVQDTNEAITRDFRFKQPFARIVFDNQ